MTRTTTPSVENQHEIAFTTEIYPEGQPPVILYFNVYGKFIGTGTIRDTFEPGVRDEERRTFTATLVDETPFRSNRTLSICTGE